MWKRKRKDGEAERGNQDAQGNPGLAPRHKKREGKGYENISWGGGERKVYDMISIKKWGSRGRRRARGGKKGGVPGEHSNTMQGGVKGVKMGVNA